MLCTELEEKAWLHRHLVKVVKGLHLPSRRARRSTAQVIAPLVGARRSWRQVEEARINKLLDLSFTDG